MPTGADHRQTVIMDGDTLDLWRWLAAGVLALHLALVVFVVGGLPAIMIGNRRGWH